MVAFEVLFGPVGVLLLTTKYTVILLAFLSKSVLYLVEGVLRAVIRSVTPSAPAIDIKINWPVPVPVPENKAVCSPI